MNSHIEGPTITVSLRGVNENSEQTARNQIDSRLAEAGSPIQNRDVLDFRAGQGIAVCEITTDIRHADDVLPDRKYRQQLATQQNTLQAKFTTSHKHTEAEKLRRLIEVKLTQMLKLNSPRVDLVEKFQKLIG